MLKTIYKRAYDVLMTKPLKLWGISLLSILLVYVLIALCGVAIPVLGLSIGLLISTAMLLMYLKGYRGEQIEITDLFMCFKDWNTIKRVLLGLGWMYLWIFLWCLIPIVGPIFAIIRIYEYRLTPYILMFEPDVSVTDAINVSKQRTNGYKLQMFWADIAYILVFYAALFVLSILAAIPVLGVLIALAELLATIAFAVLAPLFAGLVQAAFYEEINNARSANFCSGCGCPLPPGTAFCPSCGKPVAQTQNV